MTAAQTPTIAGELRAAGLRVTAARVALLETVRDGDHLGVEAIAAGVRDRVGHVSVQAVYDALHALTAAGLVQLMKTLLFGIRPLDPITFIAVLFVMVIAAVVASYLPASRAAALNAVDALKAE